MSSFSSCSSCARDRERRFNCDSIYSIKLDFVLFCTSLRSFSLSEIQRWIVSLCDFLYVLFRFFVQLFFIYELSFWSLRNRNLTIFLFIDDHDAMIVRWSSRRKRKLLKRREEASTKLCCVVCVSVRMMILGQSKRRRALFRRRKFDVLIESILLRVLSTRNALLL